jgi:2-polyprenyl-3-methyl-5-hydroxy-6-metoxy-1,4-benzoquinol methylase
MKNTPGLWDSIWERHLTPDDYQKILKQEEYTVRWRKIRRIVEDKVGTFNNLKVLEIGAGLGTYSALMAKKGADVAVLDYSEKALSRASEFFATNGVSAQLVFADALNLPPTELNKYDISMSFGTAEHFTGKDRRRIIKTHFDVLKRAGLTFISVPNKFNLPYRLYKFVCETTGRWLVGEEYPFSRKELRKLISILNPSEFCFFGESFLSSFRYLLSTPGIRKFFKRYLKKREDLIKYENATFLDPYISHSIVLYARK